MPTSQASGHFPCDCPCDCQAEAWVVSPEIIYSLKREIASPATQPLSWVSYLTWPEFSAKPWPSLELITHSFNRKCLHFQLSVGGWRADKPWMETQNRFLPHPHNALWSEKVGRSAFVSCLPRGGRMVQLWALWKCSPQSSCRNAAGEVGFS